MMKKHTILFAILMVTSILNAQLKVNSSGNTEIGSNITTSGKFNVKGNSYLEGRTELSGGNIIINGTTAQSGPALHLLASNGYPGMFLSATSSFNCSYILAVGGAITATSLYLSSDQQLKKNISALDGKLMLSKIMNLDGKKYEFISNEEIDRYYKELNNEASYSMKPSNLPKGEHYGFIAQDMEKVFPELVRTDSITKLKAIDYEGLVPVLLQSIKEQQNQINLLQETVNSLLASGKQKESAPLAPGKNTQLSNENVLHQNVPNPFSQNTSISYNLNDSVNSAMISIYDLNGTQIKSYRINQRGSGSITVSANELKSGIYIYSLIVNGCLIDTKRMVLTD